MTSVPDITRMIARIEDWQEGQGKARGRAETDRALDEADKLFDEISNMLTEIRRIAHKLPDSGRWNSGNLEVFDSGFSSSRLAYWNLSRKGRPFGAPRRTIGWGSGERLRIKR